MAKGDPKVNINITDTAVTTSSGPKKVLLVGIKTAGGSLAVNTPTPVFSDSDVTNYGGEGSQLEQMGLAARTQYSRVDLTVVAVAAPAGTPAAGAFTFGGAATTANPVLIGIEDQVITVPVEIGDAGSDIATAAALEITTNYPKLHVSAAANVAALELTAKSNGIHGNDIRLRVLKVPPGVTATVSTPMAGGAGASDVAAALASLGAVRYNLIVLPDVDATNLSDVNDELADRWTGEESIDGHAIAGSRAPVGTLATFGLAQDTKQISVFGDPYVPSNPWQQAAAVAAARAFRDNPVISLYDIPLKAISAPAENEYLNKDDRDTLLKAGISVYHYVQGVPRVRRFVTLAKTNDDGNASEALYDAETKMTVSEIRAERRTMLSTYIGRTWVDDIGATEYTLETSGYIIDPEGLRQAMINQFDTVFTPLAWVSERADWLESLVVEKTDPNTATYYEQPTINGIFYVLNGTIAFKR